jgi:hypothetical protein
VLYQPLYTLNNQNQSTMPNHQFRKSKRGSLRRKSTRIRSLYPFDSARIRRPSTEIKLFPLSFNNTFYNAAAGQYITDLTQVTQGVSGAQRVGDVLGLSSIRLHAVLNNGLGVTSNSRNICRIIIFQYFGDSSVAGKPTIADFMQTSTNNIGTTYGAFSTYDIDYSRQYRVLHDTGLILLVGNNQQVINAFANSQTYHVINTHVPLKGAERSIAFYTGTTTGPNHIFMLVTADQSTQGSNPMIQVTAEVRFTDA